jgi:hypothetical protein
MGVRTVLALCLALLTIGTAGAAATVQRGAELLANKLAELKGAERGRIVPVSDAASARAFPAQAFYVVRFRQYPTAEVPPAPLTANNLFVVKPDGSVEHLRDARALERFFRDTLAPAVAEREAEDAVAAWLRLTQEFHQDGFFEFAVPRHAIRVTSTVATGLQVTGRTDVTPRGGNTGAIVATLIFDRAGKLVSVSETTTVHKGVRPICQATKLLDPDPVVRQMAEQSIVVMGSAARDYLTEQRATASPALQHAIDRVWQRILDEHR